MAWAWARAWGQSPGPSPPSPSPSYLAISPNTNRVASVVGEVTPQERRALETRARVFKALGHPTRLFLVQQLALGPRGVSELTEAVDADVSTVSRHLALLRDAHILEAEKEGTKVTYRLRVPCVAEFFSCVEAVLNEESPPPSCGRC